jgi:carboxyl-terminal processing protease
MRLLGILASGIISIVIFFQLSVNKFDDPNKDKLLVELISVVLDRLHYDPKIIDDDFSKSVYDDYIKAIDPQKRFLLKSDIKKFDQYQLLIDDQIKSSSTDFFNLTYETLMSRVNDVESFYKEILKNPFDFNIDETLNIDFEELDYAADLSAHIAIWRKRLKLSTLDGFVTKKIIQDEKGVSDDTEKELKSDIDLESESRESILNNLKDFFVFNEDLERMDWFSIYLNSIVNQFDPHTAYLAPQAKDVFDQNISGKFQGIGARLLKRNQQVEIAEIIIGGPVWRDKLLNVGDLILGVSQTPDEEPVDISIMKLGDAVGLIKGEKGTKVYLMVKRVDGGIEQVEITRDIVELEETYAKSSLIFQDSKKYGFISLPSFYIDFNDYGQRNAASDIKKEIIKLKNENVNGIIMDLRGNGGGSLKTAVDITGFFIDQGPVVQVKSIGGRKEVLKDQDSSIIWDGPLIILVNEFSASASEILAAALQDYNRAIIIGSKQTYGKGTVQNLLSLNQFISGNTHGELGFIKLTTDKFYRISGGSTQLEGVKSDVVFPNRYSYIDIGEKDLDNPLSWDQINSAQYAPLAKQLYYDKTLENSKNRISKNEFFNIIDEQARWVKEQQEDNTVSLNYNIYKMDLDNTKKESEKFKKIDDFKSNYRFEWLRDNVLNEEIPDEIIERRNRWIKDLQKDLYVDEAINILGDLSSFYLNRLSLKNNN